MRGSEENSKNIFGDALKISEYLTSFAMATNATWPFVTLPDFEIVTGKSFNSSVGAELIMFAPRVARQDRRAFEEYAQVNQHWIKQDLQNRGLDVDPGKIPERIYFVSKDDDVETEFSAPLWQIGPAPTNSSIILKDIYSQASFRRMIDDVLIQKGILVGVKLYFRLYNLHCIDSIFLRFDSPQLSEVVDQEALDKETSSVDYVRLADQPSSYAIVPVFDSFKEDNREIVGFLFAVVPWDIYFQNILSDSAQGISVEVEDTCGSLFTYRVNGPDVSFSGHGGVQASSEFERLKQSTDFAEVARFKGGTSDLEYLQFCNYRLSVYPTQEFAQEYKSTEPIWFAMIVLAIFVFTSAVFLVFDIAVSRRQRRVMASATRTRAIVASMFPETVQERIFERADKSSEIGITSSFGQKNKLKAFLTGEHETEERERSNPIADLFPEVTIRKYAPRRLSC